MRSILLPHVGLVLLLCLHQLADSAAKSVNATSTDSSILMVISEKGENVINANRSSEATSSVLTTTELDLFNKSLNAVSNEKCRSDLTSILNGILARQPWAIAIYDATAKSAFGIEIGVLHQFGHFDECLNQVYGSPVRAQYCLADVTFTGITVMNISTRSQVPTNYAIGYWGICAPASCNSKDLENYFSNFLQRPVTVDESKCQLNEKSIHITRSMLIYVIVIAIFILLAVLSTCYHVHLMFVAKSNDKLSKTALQHETLTIALLSFSIIENTKKIFQGSREQLGLNSINGIKALAMLLILAGHALLFIFGGPVYNSSFVDQQTRNPTFAFLSNSLLFVDVFLLLSGFLFCRILLFELERRRGKVNVLFLYLGRYIRLTPAYMAVLGFYMTWFVHIGSGPLWKQNIQREQERCEKSWWLNLLYVNNYVNTDNLCMFQSWYLCVDSQMFFISPIAIYLLYKTRKYGVHLLSVAIVATAIIPFVITHLRKLDPTMLVYADEVNDLNHNSYYIGSYIKTHMRACTYIIGLLVGFLAHVMQEKCTKLPPSVVRTAWFFAIIIGIGSMYSVSRFYIAPFTNLEATLYAGFHKLGWSLSVAWLVLAVTTGHAGWLRNVLGSRIFAPLSRLTYCAYLSNGIVELYHASVVRTPGYMSYMNLTNGALSHMLDTFMLALVLCLLFESPIHALERILMRQHGSRERGTPNAKKSNSQTPSTSEEQVA